MAGVGGGEAVLRPAGCGAGVSRRVVTDIRLDSHAVGESGQKEQVWQVALDRTAFYPEGGGQPWDTGVLVATAKSGAVLEVVVERVEEDEAGEVWHYVRKPLPEGTEIVGERGCGAADGPRAAAYGAASAVGDVFAGAGSADGFVSFGCGFGDD